MPIAGIYGPEDFGSPASKHPSVSLHSRAAPATQINALPRPSLEWSTEVERATAHLYERVKSVIPPVEGPFWRGYISVPPMLPVPGTDQLRLALATRLSWSSCCRNASWLAPRRLTSWI